MFGNPYHETKNERGGGKNQWNPSQIQDLVLTQVTADWQLSTDILNKIFWCHE